MPRIIAKRTVASGALDDADYATFAEFLPACGLNEERVYLAIENPETNTADVVFIGEGDEDEEVTLLKIKPGNRYQVKYTGNQGFNAVPQGRIALKGDTASTPVIVESASIPKNADLNK